MQNKKGLLILMLPVILILILVIIKSLDKNSFSLSSKQTLEISLNQKHILNVKEFKEKLKTSEKFSIIDLRNKADFEKVHLKNAINVPFQEILKNLELLNLKSADNEIILYSNSVSESTKAWTILTQMGYQKLYLLDIPGNLISSNLLEKDTVLENNEVLKYKFQPDSLVELE